MSKGKIYWMSDAVNFNTGYSTVSLNILNGLVDKGWEVIYQSNGYSGQTIKPGGLTFEDGTTVNFTVMGQGAKPYNEDILQKRIRELRPDIFCILLDTFMVQPFYMQQDYAPAKTAFYYPSDGGRILPLNCAPILQKAHLPIAMSKFGQAQTKQGYNIDAEYAPHAINPELFKPLSSQERGELRNNWGLNGKYVVGVVARNQGRKMLDRTIKAFSLLAKQIPEAVLLLHSDPEDNAQACNLQELIDYYGIVNRVLYTGTKYYKGFPYAKMNEVYNLMDCFLLTTSGEGFGIPIIEAMAAGIPVIATNYTTTPELVLREPAAGLGIELLGGEINQITGGWNVERGLCDVRDAADKIKWLYDHPEKAKEFGKNGRIRVLEEYTWDKVVDKFDMMFTRLKNA